MVDDKIDDGKQSISSADHPDINLDSFPTFDWTKFYGDVTEATPTNMPKPLEKKLTSE